MADTIQAPWPDETVVALNRWQAEGRFHPFTCGNDSRHEVLVAREDGWHCLQCDYRQRWAHSFMVREP